jgi:hypothetical protein
MKQLPTILGQGLKPSGMFCGKMRIQKNPKKNVKNVKTVGF